MSGETIITKVLQIAIRCHKAKQPVSVAINTAREQFWRDYTPDTQAAAERAIKGYYDAQPPVEQNPVPGYANYGAGGFGHGAYGSSPAPLPNPASDSYRAKVVAAVKNPKSVTKEQLLSIGSAYGVKLARSWSKDKMLQALADAMEVSKAA